MIESLMLIALGFFLASLFALIGAQLVWRRAVTVTMRKMNATAGEAGGDATAEADESHRAELDALTQRHENELAARRAEIGRLKDEISRLTGANDALTREKASISAESEARQNEISRLKDGLASLREEIETGAAETAKQTDSVAAMSRELAKLETALGEDKTRYEAARAKLAALETAEPAIAEAPEAAAEAEDAAPAALETAHSPAPESQPVQALEPYSTEEQDADARTLAEVKASLLAELESPADARTAAEEEEDDLRRDEPPGGGRSLAERIRALEQGVAH